MLVVGKALNRIRLLCYGYHRSKQKCDIFYTDGMTDELVLMEVSHSHVIKKYEMKVVFLDIWQLECSIKNF